MNNFITINDFANHNFASQLEDVIVKSGTFPWYYGEETSTAPDSSNLIYKDKKTKDSGQLVHNFVKDGKITSEWYHLIEPFIDELEERFDKKFFNRIDRIKVNMLVNEADYPEGFYNTPHVDGVDDGVETAIYYVNDSDGETVLFNEKSNDFVEETLCPFSRITPNKGKLLLFKSNYYHSSTPPKKNKNRVVINFVFKAVS